MNRVARHSVFGRERRDVSVFNAAKASFRCGPKCAFVIYMKIPNLVGSQTVLVAKGFIDLAILEMRDASVEESKPQSIMDGIGYDRRQALVMPQLRPWPSHRFDYPVVDRVKQTMTRDS